jgi:hypothetical protein
MKKEYLILQGVWAFSPCGKTGLLKIGKGTLAKLGVHQQVTAGSCIVIDEKSQKLPILKKFKYGFYQQLRGKSAQSSVGRHFSRTMRNETDGLNSE